MRLNRLYPRKESGFSYVEILLAMVLLLILLVPAMDALSSGLMGSVVPQAEREARLREKMEEVLSRPYSELRAATYVAGGNSDTAIKTAYADASGATNRRLVIFYRCNTTTHALSSADTGLIRVKVYYQADGDAAAMETLVGQWW